MRLQRRHLDLVAAVQAAGTTPVPMAQGAGHVNDVAGLMGRRALADRNPRSDTVDAVTSVLAIAHGGRRRAGLGADGEAEARHLLAVRELPRLDRSGQLADEANGVDVLRRRGGGIVHR